MGIDFGGRDSCGFKALDGLMNQLTHRSLSMTFVGDGFNRKCQILKSDSGSAVIPDARVSFCQNAFHGFGSILDNLALDWNEEGPY